MDPNKKLVPVRIAHLIYGFVNESLSPNENQELDDWINLSDDNMEVFDVLTGILEPDETGTSFRIATLSRGFDKRILSPHEYEELDE